MDLKDPLLLVILGVAMLATGYWVVAHFFSQEARWERRRRRSNAPIASKSNRRSVKLSVRANKDRRR